MANRCEHGRTALFSHEVRLVSLLTRAICSAALLLSINAIARPIDVPGNPTSCSAACPRLIRVGAREDSLRADRIRQEHLRQEALHNEALRQKALHDEAIRQNALHAKALHDQAIRDELLQEDRLREARRLDALRLEALRRERQLRERRLRKHRCPLDQAVIAANDCDEPPTR